MPRASRKKATRSRSRGRSLLMGGTGRRRGVSKRRSTRRKTGRGLLPGFMKDMIYAFAPAGLPGMGRRRRYSRRTRGGAMKKASHAAPAAQAAAAAHVAAKTPAKSGSRVKTALKGLAGLATALGAAYLGRKVAKNARMNEYKNPSYFPNKYKPLESPVYLPPPQWKGKPVKLWDRPPT